MPIDDDPKALLSRSPTQWLEPVKGLRGASRVREEFSQWTARTPSPFGAWAVATRLWRKIAQARGYGRR